MFPRPFRVYARSSTERITVKHDAIEEGFSFGLRMIDLTLFPVPLARPGILLIARHPQLPHFALSRRRAAFAERGDLRRASRQSSDARCRCLATPCVFAHPFHKAMTNLQQQFPTTYTKPCSPKPSASTSVSTSLTPARRALQSTSQSLARA